jgi:hypothetical protein
MFFKATMTEGRTNSYKVYNEGEVIDARNSKVWYGYAVVYYNEDGVWNVSYAKTRENAEKNFAFPWGKKSYIENNVKKAIVAIDHL